MPDGALYWFGNTMDNITGGYEQSWNNGGTITFNSDNIYLDKQTVVVSKNQLNVSSGTIKIYAKSTRTQGSVYMVGLSDVKPNWLQATEQSTWLYYEYDNNIGSGSPVVISNTVSSSYSNKYLILANGTYRNSNTYAIVIE